jgi:hypothetical protein
MFGGIYFGQIEFGATPLLVQAVTPPVLLLDLSAPAHTTADTELLLTE